MSTPRSAYDGKGPKNSIRLLHTRAEECMYVVVCGCCATTLFIWRFSSRCNNVKTTTIGTIRQPKHPWLHFTPRNKVGEQLKCCLLPHLGLDHTKMDATMKSETNTHLPSSRSMLGLVACVTAKICSHRRVRVEISTRTRWFFLCWKFVIFHAKFMCGVSPYPTQPLFALPLHHWVPLQTLPTVGRLLPLQSVPKTILNFPKPCFQIVL